MKIVVRYVCLLICLFAASCSIKARPDGGLQGKVRSNTIYGYDVEHPGNKEWTYKIIETYNKLGKQTANQAYLNNHGIDSVFFSVNYVYDSKGNKTRVLDNGGKETARYEYSDDDQVEKIWFGLKLAQIIHKDKMGNIVEKLDYDAAGNFQYKTIYPCITKNKVEDDYYTSNGSINYKRISTYNKWHDKIDELILNPDGTRRSHEKNTYDNAGNRLTQIDSNLTYVGGLPMKKEDKNIYSRTFRYDIFDKAGNWVEQSYLINNKYVVSIKREIAYY